MLFDAFAFYLQSKIKQNFDDLPGAVASAEHAIALEPHNPDFHAQLAEVYAYSAERASWVKGIGLVRQMKKEIAAAFAVNPKHTDTLLVNMMFCMRAPLVAGGDKRHARAIADEMVQTDPRWGYLAEARLIQDDGKDAPLERWLKQAVQTDPSHYRAGLELATFYCCVAVSRNLTAAETQARQLLHLDPNRSGAYTILSRVYATTQRWTDLDAILAQSEHTVPEDLSPFYHAAATLIENGHDLPRAERYLQKYLSQAPEGRQPTHAQARALLASLRHDAQHQ